MWLAANPGGATYEEVAAGIHARAYDVRRVLRVDGRFVGPFLSSARSEKALLYSLVSSDTKKLPDVSGCALGRPSQNKRILDVLADRGLHTVTEIHQRAGTSRLNSRVSELRHQLRPKGFDIECVRTGGTGPDSYAYRLVETEGVAA